MAFDVGAETVRVLSEGLAPPPQTLERGETAPFALWTHLAYGAVLFIRRWRNDVWDSDCAITAWIAMEAGNTR